MNISVNLTRQDMKPPWPSCFLSSSADAYADNKPAETVTTVKIQQNGMAQ
jgi:hypothetical protein